MSLKEKLAEASQTTQRDSFEIWLDTLPTAEREALIKFASHPGITHRAFVEIVKSEGAKVGREKVTAWRKSHGYIS
ncbi:hypothetical protein [Cryobacterium sp. BB736]|uniref:hypothetical protein n=1 Tax=Cryobacterium sp. BB736 TaxID=2746963 RepID=UPI00187543C2|nr:hypothetical protein [Cryobacterium sp. BB736]